MLILQAFITWLPLKTKVDMRLANQCYPNHKDTKFRRNYAPKEDEVVLLNRKNGQCAEETVDAHHLCHPTFKGPSFLTEHQAPSFPAWATMSPWMLWGSSHVKFSCLAWHHSTAPEQALHAHASRLTLCSSLSGPSWSSSSTLLPPTPDSRHCSLLRFS